MPSETHIKLRVLDRGEAVSLLSDARLGRIGLSIGALPVILPVNYVVVDEGVVFRTARGTKLSAASDGAVVAFEVDHFAPDGSWGWSVLIRGTASEATDPDVLRRVQELALESWGVDGHADHYVLISAAEISGRRFGELPKQQAAS
jgi:nitroimidazol reductase NimA-like FMN-containing flavoprotein (pyridoxamine 5'-phosphate oxidase superfamily)